MRFIVDECTGSTVARWLRAQGHDILSVYDEARGIDDDEVLRRAVAEERIVVTNDKDFGEQIFRLGREHCGVVLLRLDDERATRKIAALERLLAEHADVLRGRFTVVTERSIRIIPAR